jgi:hypothetical protein
MPRQESDSVAVWEAEDCRGNGDLHNHPQNLGGKFAGALQQPSGFDFKSFGRHENLRFMLVWYGPGKYTAHVKVSPE